MLEVAIGRGKQPIASKPCKGQQTNFALSEFSEVRRSKRPDKPGHKHPRGAWRGFFGVLKPRRGSVRCSVVYQGVATRNGATTRETPPIGPGPTELRIHGVLGSSSAPTLCPVALTARGHIHLPSLHSCKFSPPHHLRAGFRCPPA